MATKKNENEEVTVVKQEHPKYKGWQLLKMPEYKTRVARVVIKANESYSLEEVNKAISDYMKKKG